MVMDNIVYSWKYWHGAKFGGWKCITKLHLRYYLVCVAIIKSIERFHQILWLSIFTVIMYSTITRSYHCVQLKQHVDTLVAQMKSTSPESVIKLRQAAWKKFGDDHPVINRDLGKYYHCKLYRIKIYSILFSCHWWFLVVSMTYSRILIQRRKR